MDVVSEIVETIQNDGVAPCLKAGAAFWARADEAMQSIYKKGLGSVTAELVLRRLYLSFSDCTISAFRTRVEVQPESALEQLHTTFRDFVAVLQRIGNQLECREIVSQFKVKVKCEILEPDLLQDSACGCPALQVFLRRHGESVLSKLETSPNAWGESGVDQVLAALNTLTFSASLFVKQVWLEVLDGAIRSKVAALEEDFSESNYAALHKWKSQVVDQFIQLALSGGDADEHNSRVEIDQWYQHTSQLLDRQLGQRLLAGFFDLVVEFPDSTPALNDLQQCLQHDATGGLYQDLVERAKRTLAQRLHHAGARTEDILTILVSAIRALSVLLSKSDHGSALFAIVNDTLQHLKQRKDSVEVVVRSITQPQAESLLYTELLTYSAQGVSEEETHGVAGSTWKYNQRPDVLRILLSALSVSAIVQEYKNVLCRQLLDKVDFDTTKEEEVLERLKRFLGEDVLAPCIVMLRDLQQSRRLNMRVKVDSELPFRVTTLSLTCWPLPTFKDGFKPHPSIAHLMDGYADAFKKHKPNQSYKWLGQLGTVCIRVHQQGSAGPAPVDYELDVFTASAALHLQERPFCVADLAAAMDVTEPQLMSSLKHHSPALFVIKDNDVSLQTSQISAAVVEHAEADDSKPVGFTDDQVQLYSNLITAMVKNGGSKSVQQVENSMRMFGKFEGDTAAVRNLLQYLVRENKLSSADGTTFGAVKH